jgi:hypothetical protein
MELAFKQEFKHVTKLSKSEKEILEMILQFCYENKYLNTAKLIESKTNIIYDQNEIQELKYFLKNHKFQKSIEFLENSNFENLQKAEVLKIIKSRNLIEKIKNNKKEEALLYIRKELSPLFDNLELLNKFSSLLFIKEKENLERCLRHNFSDLNSDDSLILKVQNLLCLSLDSNGNRILPNSRLENMLNKFFEILEKEKIFNNENNYNYPNIDISKNTNKNTNKIIKEKYEYDYINNNNDIEMSEYDSNKNFKDNLNTNFDVNSFDINLLIGKKIEEIYEIFDGINNNNKNFSLSDNYNFNDNENDNTYSNFEYNNNNNKLNFNEIFTLEKNEEEIWHMEFTLSKKYFAICYRNGIINIFSLNLLSNYIDKNVDFQKQIKMEVDLDLDLNKELEKIELEKLKKENIIININCLISFLSHNKSVTSISWSKNEKFLLTSSISKEIFLWNPFFKKI